MPLAVDVIPAPADQPGPLEGAGSSDRGPWWARPIGPVALVLALTILITIRGSTTYHGGRTFLLFDDAMISMRYARNLADGHGLVFNVGQHPVEGYTNFLWTLWMAALHLLPVPVRWVPALVSASGGLLVAATVVLVGRIAGSFASSGGGRDMTMVAAFAMWGVALWYPLLWWSVRGLEPGLLAAVLAFSVGLALRIDRDGPTTARVAWIAAALTVGVLTRTDFAVVAFVVLAWLAWRAGPVRRSAALLAGVVGFVLVAHTGFRLAYYGGLVPNTYVLKIEGIPLWTRLDRGLRALGAVVAAELAVLLCFAVLAVWRRRRTRPIWLLVLPVIAAAAYSASVGGDAWEWTQSSNRFLAPVGPLVFVVAGLGIADVLRATTRRRALTVGIVAGVTTAAIVLNNRMRPAGDGVRAWANLDEMRRPHWLALGCGVILLAVGLIAASSRVENRRLAFGAIAAGVIVVVALPSWMEWRRTDGALVETSKQEARLGLGLRDSALPGRHPSIAVVAAGNIPYWSMLPTVDVLGKVDPVIAHRPPHHIPFNPGHNKWDYRYSVCKLRPDVVVQLWDPSVKTIRMIERCGYKNIVALDRNGRVVTYYLVRNGQTGFDKEALRRGVFGRGATVER